MSIHNMLFFRDCVNYIPGRITRRGTSMIINSMSDNRYTTYSTETDIDIDMAVGGAASAIDAVFVKYDGVITSYTFTPTGGVGSAFTRTVPTEVMTYEGSTTDLTVDNFKHDLHELTTDTTATSVRLQFSGSNIRIYALMLLETGIELIANGPGRMFSVDDPDYVDRTGRLQPNISGGIRYAERIGQTREKWETDFRVEFRRGSAVTAKDFAYWRSKNKNFVLAREFSRNPEEVYPATFMDTAIGLGYRSNWKPQGRRSEFRVGER